MIRNFCIIAHIDHGKSTLADRLLELTNTISEREKKEQILDSMDLERERGITIKMTPVRMEYNGYILNLIDTPGHVDFTYEVSRALAAVEGAVLIIDATQGIQAQTLANLYLAEGEDLTIIPVINKIDLPFAEVEKTCAEVSALIGVPKEEIILISAKTGENVPQLLKAVIDRVPAPSHKNQLLLKREVKSHDDVSRALIFDSNYNQHRGVVADIRVIDGEFSSGDTINFYQTNFETTIKEIGVYRPKMEACQRLSHGEIGYIVTGIRDIGKCHVGDTIIKTQNLKLKTQNFMPLPGYKKVHPMVFASIYPKDQHRYLDLRQALLELQLNDSALQYQPASTQAIGKGFQVGVLGLLHLDIISERIVREHGVEVVLTVPQVEYRIKLKTSEDVYAVITSPQEFPENPSNIDVILEPWVKMEIITPEAHIGGIMQLSMQRRGIYTNTEYLRGSDGEGSRRVILHFEIPFTELLTDFYDKLKSASSGYASLSYDIDTFRPVDLIRVDFLVAGELRESLSMLVPRRESYMRARSVIDTLLTEIPPQMFEIRLQAAIGGKIIASDSIRATRKDVTAKLYGGDVTRKMKLLEKQKKGKKKMAGVGRVDIPNSAYLAVLRR
ncbi:MAG: elongation factor 4 [Candidatus Jacksonbacteria bacterium RIFCSPLOWO2_02_FULL_44_20]|uniref:Elongation factor 4 n=1 Tax=Candidatus Jacksonbacteria bacterium RIFCSPLOWO2_02_FULL_44_20 TaxID=1798460 RepID=A0A1G2A9Q2_9BACT|nr:MAG: Elongation factor 4 [Parcubacteria group bacterium GW2011_GWF2_44_17]OGY70680.1 MAG: elongation factor 4 [Candidatus Jacksonbacteria bacterium RIFCSPHIGHO2_12_FULL_44_12]OGY70868.1 MAG: elongation factor 4 [Candidatus Jacksonbacteria bacterium RIFCSPHIGHO2_02_FULL_44_25]OGY72946.1 MAG: elongation factor 4 [Candidatus Jacksonbacteria bacterium RIFCSPLOWO2_12_FULL_44_15b]OGY73584.1 MAG: elongation factor 4 [Candidatus Jacksonbacteria bacterium RIFCSPLOWO2_02_FULL_44_20]HCA67464.1 elongat